MLIIYSSNLNYFVGYLILIYGKLKNRITSIRIIPIKRYDVSNEHIIYAHLSEAKSPTNRWVKWYGWSKRKEKNEMNLYTNLHSHCVQVLEIGNWTRVKWNDSGSHALKTKPIISILHTHFKIYVKCINMESCRFPNERKTFFGNLQQSFDPDINVLAWHIHIVHTPPK